MNKAEVYPSVDRPWMQYYSTDPTVIALPDGTLYEYLKESNRERMDTVAMNYYGTSVTFRRLIEQIDRTAEALAERGVKHGDRIILYVLTTPESIYTIYAINKLGAIADIQYLNKSPQEIRASIEESPTKMIVSADVFASRVQETLSSLDADIPLLVLETESSLPSLKRFALKLKKRTNSRSHGQLTYAQLLKTPLRSPAHSPAGKGEDLAVVIYTGGTTGKPKGVRLSNRNLNALVHEYKFSLLSLQPGDTMLNIAPPCHAFGISLAIHSPLCSGLCICIVPDPNPLKAGGSYLFYRPNYYLGGPQHLRSLVNDPKLQRANLSYAKIVSCGGESLPLATERAITTFFRDRGADLYTIVGYGMTEFCGTVTTGCNRPHKESSVGLPLPLSNIKIVDVETGNELPVGKVGEIWLSSPTLMMGYINAPEESAKVLIQDPDGTRWMKTGDLGYVDEDGFVFIAGRIKRIYLTKDSDDIIYKLFPDYIETVICEIDEVASCGVVPRKVDEETSEPVAFVVMKEDSKVQPEDILKHCQNRLAVYMVPKEIHFLDAMPATAVGKTDYAQLEKRLKY